MLKTAQKCKFSETLLNGVIEGADDDGNIHFARSAPTDLVTPVRSMQLFSGPRYTTKIVFDVTSSGANGRPARKINMSIVISTLDNPNSESFRESTFLSCAKLLQICSILSQTASYIEMAVFQSECQFYVVENDRNEENDN
ncbi:hypothetical protein PRIPAC_85528 [Pristionchus pacificus]|uniref:Uncharacterized protein n=1 Tax=Pristionchus pacificus TaxID=54126 RepID=A0A2A6BP07_PRIPA|nr:hypothetical protein PRIPAC_85528 [Pristionchus pacificus]|eukprot:PDM67556.1 hypothetical protein PRIPAC_48973 [Pristionchus pacificus]